MKKLQIRISALLVCAALLASAVYAAGYQSIDAGGIELSDTAELQNGILAQKNASSFVRETIVTYDAESAVRPIVFYGKTLYGRSTLSHLEQYLSDDDLTVAAAINGAFFEVNSGIPIGMVVTDGILRSSGNVNSVGFFKDGSAIIGKPELNVTAELPSGENVEINYNKALTRSNGFCLYSSDYDSVTKGGISAEYVLLEPVGDEDALTMDGSIELQIVGKGTQSACPIPENGFTLCFAVDSIYASGLSKIRQLSQGERITVTTTCDRDWRDVRYACGGGDMLVRKGKTCDDFTLSGADSPDARTAIGVRRDGSLVMYTCDETEGSEGLSLSQLADRMKELDCETALNLDGGSSTTVCTTLPGTGKLTTVIPADGAERACANYILLVRSQSMHAQSADRLCLYPYHAVMLPNAELTLDVKAVDRNYQAAAVPNGLSFEATRGSITADGVFTAGDRPGTAAVSASAGGASGSVKIRIISEPTSVSVKKQESGKNADGAMIVGGTTLDLTASAGYYGMAVSASDRSFSWSVSGNIGEIDENGVFTAVHTGQPLDGTITASCGGVSASAKVTITPSDPFADMQGHWAKDYVSMLYYSKVLAGSTGSDGKLYFRPDDSMTRQEFVVSLIRFLNADTEKYADTALPFADAGKIASWAVPAMKAAYACGYVGGSSANGKLYANPTSPISRQESMVILSRALSVTADGDTDALDQFPDCGSVASWARDALSAMVERGIISGSNGYLRPTGNVRRAEVAKMLYVIAERS